MLPLPEVEFILELVVFVGEGRELVGATVPGHDAERVCEGVGPGDIDKVVDVAVVGQPFNGSDTNRVEVPVDKPLDVSGLCRRPYKGDLCALVTRRRILAGVDKFGVLKSACLNRQAGKDPSRPPW